MFIPRPPLINSSWGAPHVPRWRPSSSHSLTALWTVVPVSSCCSFRSSECVELPLCAPWHRSTLRAALTVRWTTHNHWCQLFCLSTTSVMLTEPHRPQLLSITNTRSLFLGGKDRHCLQISCFTWNEGVYTSPCPGSTFQTVLKAYYDEVYCMGWTYPWRESKWVWSEEIGAPVRSKNTGSKSVLWCVAGIWELWQVWLFIIASPLGETALFFPHSFTFYYLIFVSICFLWVFLFWCCCVLSIIASRINSSSFMSVLCVCAVHLVSEFLASACPL